MATEDDVAIAEAITSLTSGLRVVTEHVPGALSLSAGVWVGVGSRDEPDRLCGVSHFLEHLLFRGTETRSAREISASVDRVGGDMNAFTSKEYTAYYCRLPQGQLDLAIDLLGDVVSAPALRDDDVENERQVILEELAMDEDAPDDTAFRLLGEALFPGHPLGRDSAGHPETVEALSPAEIRAFFAEHYTASSMVVAVAGPVDHDEVVARAEQAFAKVPVREAGRTRRAPDRAAIALNGEQRDCEQVHLVIGFHALDRFDLDREALDVVVQVLGGGPSSRLFQSIREDRGLTYSTFASSSSFADCGSFGVYAATNPEHAVEVLGLLRLELDRMIDSGISADELDIAKGYLTGSYAMGFEGTGSRASRLGGLLTSYGEIRPIGDQIARWDAVTIPDVERVIARVLGGPRVLCSVGPVDPASLA